MPFARRLCKIFQSTLPVWGATSAAACPADKDKNFNPRSPCGERRIISSGFMECIEISIHAPRVGSDRCQYVNVHNFYKFQSTLPVWGATFEELSMARNLNISIHAPRVGSDGGQPRVQ